MTSAQPVALAVDKFRRVSYHDFPMDLNPRAHPETPRRSFAADFLVLGALIAALFGTLEVGREWHQPFHREVEISLSPWMLPYYTLLSLSRGVLAYILSFAFTLFYARWAAYDRTAERFLIPLLDILQSVPFLAFLTPLEILLVGLFPHYNLGLELTCVLIIFTGQVWNMTFSFYYSLKNLPPDFAFVGKLARFTPWQKFTQIEIPFATKGLVYNSMVSMAGGWFFLTVNEAFTLNGQDFRLPGIGSYMNEAQAKGDGWAQLYAVIAMVTMIVAIDQLVWRPLLVWSNKFKIEDTEASFQDSSNILLWLSRSTLANRLHDSVLRRVRRDAPKKTDSAPRPPNPFLKFIARVPWRKIFLTLACIGIVYGVGNVILLLSHLTVKEWLTIAGDLLLTLVRVLAAIVFSTIIAVPIGIWIGSSPRLARYLMPITQIAASFPAPMVFPNLLFLIFLVGGSLQWGAVVLMMLGTIWYILFNVISGASAIPQDLKACAQLMHLTRVQRWRTLYFPGVFPALTTGWITAAGGAWNASIVSEYVQYHNHAEAATGLGWLISDASNRGDTPLLAGSVLAMALFVVFFNRLVWKRISAIAQDRFQLLT